MPKIKRSHGFKGNFGKEESSDLPSVFMYADNIIFRTYFQLDIKHVGNYE